MRSIHLLLLMLIVMTCAATTFAQAVPPSTDTAAQVVGASTRHGEWVEIALPDGVKLKTWAVFPERADKAPVVIVIHEILGLTDWIRAVTDQLAANGYIALAPDLLSGYGENGGGTSAIKNGTVQDAIRKITPDEYVPRLNAVRDYALALPAASDKTAAIGFCWGGAATFEYATRQPKLNAAFVYYGTGPKDTKALANITCPVFGFYGGDDARVTSTVDGSAAAMKEAGKNFTPTIFAGAGHGFLRQQTGREGANEKAANEAWKKTLEQLKQTLETAKP